MKQTDLQGETERALRAATCPDGCGSDFLDARLVVHGAHCVPKKGWIPCTSQHEKLLPLFNAGVEQARRAGYSQAVAKIYSTAFCDLGLNVPDSGKYESVEDALLDTVNLSVAGAYAAAAKLCEKHANEEEARGPIHPALVSDVDEYSRWMRTYIFQFRAMEKAIRNLTPADARQAQPPDLKHETLSHTRNCGSLIGEDCSCGLEWRQHLQTEQTMHAAWRKRAEEAESAIASAEARARLELSFSELRAANLSRCGRWHPRGLNEWSLSDWGIATAGEMGEALNIIKKLNRERDGIAGNSLTADQLRGELADEIADVAIYLDILAASEGIDLAAAIVSKFNRTSKKVGFPERLAAARPPDSTKGGGQ